MKKLILSLTLVCACAAANAQQTIYNPKFTDNVYIGVNGGVNTNLAFDEAFPLNPTFGVRLGKDFNPIFGVFVEGTAWFGSHTEKDNRIFPERFDLYRNAHGDFVSDKHNAFRAANVGVYGTINLSNAIGGYQGEPRTFEVSTVAGLGWGMVFIPSNKKNVNLGKFAGKDEDRDHLSAKAGMDFAFNLGSQKEHQIYIEPAVIWNLNKSGFDGIEFNKHYAYLSLSLGYNYKFGCSYGGHNFKTGRDCDAELAKLQALLDDCRRNPKVETKIEYRDREVPGPERIVYRDKPGIAIENLKVVPFEVNKWYISDHAKNDLNSIPAGAHVQIIGTASPEGNAAWNKELSNNRAQAVADYLSGRGVVVDSCEGRGVEGKTSNRLAIVYVTSRPE